MGPEFLVTGVGVTSAIGCGKDAFISHLLDGAHAFRVMERPGRQNGSAYLGAELPPLEGDRETDPRILRTASFSSQVALLTLAEAWRDACLEEIAPTRIGLIVGGCNFQQREQSLIRERYSERPEYLRPTYGMSFMDTDLSAICLARFPIRGMAHTLGGASASGQLAVIEAIEAVASGRVDACIALGPLMDLSHWELRALKSLGAMGSDRYADRPAEACRPFDLARDGFIFGECCGAVVVERARAREPQRLYGRLAGWAVALDGNRNPDPSLEGEKAAIVGATERAGYAVSTIDYVNLHGTGSSKGDAIEIDAIRSCGLGAARLNATKSLIGHGLTAAGAVEVVATLLQMRCGRLHPTRNLEDPLDPSLNWVRSETVTHSTQRALTLSFGFGGVYTALCIENLA